MSNRPGRAIRPNVAKALTAAEHWWQGLACELLKQALCDSGLGYRELSDGLRAHGVSIPPAVLNQRINRGTFSADFLLLCLQIVEVPSIRFDGMQNVELDYGEENREHTSAALALEQKLGFRK